MTNFFSTMINRHLGAAEVIAPRARARFEPENRIAAVDNPTDHMKTEQSQAHQEEQDRHVTEKSTELGFNGYGKEGHLNVPIIQEHLSTVFPSKEQRKVDASSVETHQQLKAQSSPLRIPPIEEHQPPIGHMYYEVPGEKTLESELDNRIETLLQRLRGQQAPQPLATRADNSNRGSLSQPLEVETWGKQDPKFHMPSVMPTQAGREEIGKLSKQPAASLPQKGRKTAADENLKVTTPSTKPSSRHAGLLELPSWLSEMQAEFNQRWQAMNSKAEAEPVINVTIGRVEVRAVQAEPPKQSKRKNKPISVMGLDEYLNQRGRGGRT